MVLHWKCKKYFETFGTYYFTNSVSLVDLLGRRAFASHGEGDPIVSELSHGYHVLASIQGLLRGDEFVPLHGDRGAALPPVRGRLLKRLPQPGQVRIIGQSPHHTTPHNPTRSM